MDIAVPRSALLCQLEPSLQAELKSALSHPDLAVSTYTCSGIGECRQFTDTHSPDILFCPLTPDLREFVSCFHGRIPIIVVSRVPDTREWIAAMEAGASDYCAPPFECSQLRWILTSAQHGSNVLRAGA
jgi:DNA-binding response OmpR family regulator